MLLPDPAASDQQQDRTHFLESLLHEIWMETRKGRVDIPMAALCKRLGVRMSTLQRHLTGLADYQLVETACDETGRWTVRLAVAGYHLFDQAA